MGKLIDWFGLQNSRCINKKINNFDWFLNSCFGHAININFFPQLIDFTSRQKKSKNILWNSTSFYVMLMRILQELRKGNVININGFFKLIDFTSRQKKSKNILRDSISFYAILVRNLKELLKGTVEISLRFSLRVSLWGTWRISLWSVQGLLKKTF